MQKMLLFSNEAAIYGLTFSQNSWKSLCPRRKKSGNPDVGAVLFVWIGSCSCTHDPRARNLCKLQAIILYIRWTVMIGYGFVTYR